MGLAARRCSASRCRRPSSSKRSARWQPLIDENRFSYSLDALCAWRGLPGKDEALLEEAVKAAGFKVSKKNPLQSYIWQLPAHLVGPYAEADRGRPRWRYLRT